MTRLYFYGGILAGLLLIGGGIYLKGRDDGKEAIRAQYAANFSKATIETARIEAERDALSKKVEDELKPKLAAADADARDLARRLRIATRSRTLSQTPGTAPEPAPASGVPGSDESLERRTEEVFAACGRDSTRLDGWREWYSAAKAITQNH